MKILMFAMKLNNWFKLCVKIFYDVDGNEMEAGGRGWGGGAGQRNIDLKTSLSLVCFTVLCFASSSTLFKSDS